MVVLTLFGVVADGAAAVVLGVWCYWIVVGIVIDDVVAWIVVDHGVVVAVVVGVSFTISGVADACCGDVVVVDVVWCRYFC